ncbi:MAG: hypothetical protein QNJ70_19175 [Xenococcaceae cyanobacterium MO_207.B15]|nr:hypothetical protein [Xenococcaceae cyanobacterium MO_207.B15]
MQKLLRYTYLQPIQIPDSYLRIAIAMFMRSPCPNFPLLFWSGE